MPSDDQRPVRYAPSLPRWLPALLGLVCAAAAAACSSPSVAAEAQAGRAAALPAARALPAKIAASGAAWTAEVVGGYLECGSNDPLATPGDGSVQYTAQMLLTAYSRNTPYPLFSRRVVKALNGLGWGLRQVTGGSSLATYYAGRQRGIDLRLIELDQPQTFGPTATVFLSSPCFAAGSSAQQLMATGASDSITEPAPTTTPASRYP